MVPSGESYFIKGCSGTKGKTGGSPWRTTEKKNPPRLSPVTESANRSRVCTKRAEPWGCPGPQQNKTFKEQKRCAPLFRPGHRLKYRRKAIKIWEPQKKHRPFFFFYVYTKSRFCPRQNRAVIAAKEVLYPKAMPVFHGSKSAKSVLIIKNGTELQKSPSHREELKNNRLNSDRTFKGCQGF